MDNDIGFIVEISDNVEIKIAPGMIADIYTQPEKTKTIKTSKDVSRTRAIEIFPKISDQLKRKKDSNKADAILIASYYYNTYKTE